MNGKTINIRTDRRALSQSGARLCGASPRADRPNHGLSMHFYIVHVLPTLYNVCQLYTKKWTMHVYIAWFISCGKRSWRTLCRLLLRDWGFSFSDFVHLEPLTFPLLQSLHSYQKLISITHPLTTCACAQPDVNKCYEGKKSVAIWVINHLKKFRLPTE